MSMGLDRRSLLRGVAGAAALSLLPRSSSAANESQNREDRATSPNILWVMADQFRKQAVGFMGQDSVHTPNLDRLAGQGAIFTNAISDVPVCTPNRACQFSGQNSIRTGVLCNDTSLLPQFRTLGDRAKAAGYKTAYFGKWHLGYRREPGASLGYVPPDLRHGFDTWYATQEISPFLQPHFIGDAKQPTAKPGWAPDMLTDVACDYLSKHDRSKPFCMVVSFGPPHNMSGPGLDERFSPRAYPAYKFWKEYGGERPPISMGYKAPAQDEQYYLQGGDCYRRPIRANAADDVIIEQSKCIQGYFGSVTAIDRVVGRLLQQLEASQLTENTIVIFTSDHGEMLASHGLFAKDEFYQESVGIPLIIRWPGKVRAARYDNVVSSIDFLPTLADLAGLDTVGFDGQSCGQLLRGAQQSVRQYAYGSYFQGSPTEGPRHFRSVYTKDLTYAMCDGTYCYRFSPEVMFDRSSDPYELKPIHRGMGRDNDMNSLQELLRAELDKLGDPFFSHIWEPQMRGRPANYGFYDAMISKVLS